MTQERAALGWGTALLAAGGLLLLREAGMMPDVIPVWPWPLLAAGLVLLVHALAVRDEDLTLPILLTSAGAIFAVRETVPMLRELPVVPLVLVVMGAVLAASGLVRRGRTAPTEQLRVPIDDATGVRFRLMYGGGTLRVSGGAALGLACEGTFRGGVRRREHRVSERDGELEITLGQVSHIGRILWAGGLPDWDLAVTDAVPVDLEVQTGASQVRLDLDGVNLRSLVIKTGAADVDVALPGRGRYRVDVDAGAAEVSIRVPDTVAGSIRTRSGLASVNIDAVRFPKANGTHRSRGFEDAADRAEIELEGGVAAFTVR